MVYGFYYGFYICFIKKLPWIACDVNVLTAHNKFLYSGPIILKIINLQVFFLFIVFRLVGINHIVHASQPHFRDAINLRSVSKSFWSHSDCDTMILINGQSQYLICSKRERERAKKSFIEWRIMRYVINPSNLLFGMEKRLHQIELLHPSS